MIVGWKVANSLKSDLATDALAMAMAPRPETEDLIHQKRSRRPVSLCGLLVQLFWPLVCDLGVVTTDERYDNALAESLNGLYKTEFNHAIGLLDDEIAVEWETCKWVDWFNNETASLLDWQ
ncbi:MAG: hypothetical protein ACP5HZ_10135, partial [Ferrimicrobium sp.]